MTDKNCWTCCRNKESGDGYYWCETTRFGKGVNPRTAHSIHEAISVWSARENIPLFGMPREETFTPCPGWEKK